MEFFPNTDPQIVKWVIIPSLIFFARLLDVSIGTLRIVFIARGDKVISPILGFFEVLIWVIAIGQVIQNLNSPAAYIAWAGGFAVGNYLGLYIEQKLALGRVVLRVISTEPATELMNELTQMQFRTIILDAESEEGRMNVLFTIVRRRQIDEIIPMIREKMPKAFFTIESIQQFSDAFTFDQGAKQVWWRRLFPLRKGK